MHIKRFEADTLDEALAQVRERLGADALILSTRSVQRGRGAFGLFARMGVEVQAALERGAPGRRAGAADDAAGARLEAIGPAGEGAPERDAFAALVGDLRRELGVLRRRESFEEEVRSELRGLRQALGRRPEREGDPGSERVSTSLARAGVDWIHAEALAAAWAGDRASGRARSIEGLLHERIEARLAPPRTDLARRIRILVGAPGAGKTTTLAKLAGRSDEGEREVAFVSLDPFRIGARDQLRGFANLLEAPFDALSTPASLPEIARRHPEHAILVDTAGRSPGDGERLAALDALHGPLRAETSIELVVDATARREVARAQLARFAPLRPDRLILTKLDECDDLAPVVNLLLDDGCPPVCWLGTGQRVPEDLEIAEPGRFVSSLLGRAA